MNVINNFSRANQTSVINNKTYIVVATNGGLTILNETDNKSLHSIDTSKFTKVHIWNDYVYATKYKDSTLYRSSVTIPNMVWTTSGASVIVMDPILVDDRVTGNNLLNFDNTDTLTIAASNNLKPSTMDFTLLVKTSAKLFTDEAVNKIIGSASGGLDLFLSITGVFTAQKNGTGNVGTPTSKAILSKPTVFGYKRSASIGYYYIDGKLVHSAADANDYTVALTSISSTFNQDFSGASYFNYALSERRIQELSMGGELLENEKWGKNLASGTLSIGTTYTVVATLSTDSFSNVGWVTDGVPFVATATTPTVWTNSSIVVKEGCNVELKADNYNATTLLNGTAITGKTAGTAYLFSSEFMEGTDAAAANDTLKATQATAANQPLLLDTPSKLALMQKNYPGDISYLKTMTKFNGVDNYVSVADNANLNFGTGDFSLGWCGALTDYTPSAEKILIDKSASNLGYRLSITTTGVIKLSIGNGTNFTTYSYSSPSVINLPDNARAYLLVSIDRDGNCVFYCNNVSLGSVSITASAAQTITNTGVYRLFYDGTNFSAAKLLSQRSFNLALTSSDVTLLYNNGRPDLYKLPGKWKWGNQTALTSGTLIIGNTYSIDTYVSGDDFTNVATVISGTINTSGCIFLCKATTPTTWTNSSSLRKLGVVAEYDFTDPTKFLGATILDSSDNNLDGISYGDLTDFRQDNQPYATTIHSKEGKLLLGYGSDVAKMSEDIPTRDDYGQYEDNSAVVIIEDV